MAGKPKANQRSSTPKPSDGDTIPDGSQNDESAQEFLSGDGTGANSAGSEDLRQCAHDILLSVRAALEAARLVMTQIGCAVGDVREAFNSEPSPNRPSDATSSSSPSTGNLCGIQSAHDGMSSPQPSSDQAKAQTASLCPEATKAFEDATGVLREIAVEFRTAYPAKACQDSTVVLRDMAIQEAACALRDMATMIGQTVAHWHSAATAGQIFQANGHMLHARPPGPPGNLSAPDWHDVNVNTVHMYADVAREALQRMQSAAEMVGAARGTQPSINP